MSMVWLFVYTCCCSVFDDRDRVSVYSSSWEGVIASFDLPGVVRSQAIITRSNGNIGEVAGKCGTRGFKLRLVCGFNKTVAQDSLVVA